MTPYDVVFNSFLDLIIRDTTFFIKNEDKNIEKTLNETRKLKLLKHAVTNMMCVRDKQDFEINFMEIMDDITLSFKEELTLIEINLLAYYMWMAYIDEEVVVRLKALKTLGFSDDEIKTFSPANSLKEFKSTYNALRVENEYKVKEYKRRGRLDFKNKIHKFNFGE